MQKIVLQDASTNEDLYPRTNADSVYVENDKTLTLVLSLKQDTLISGTTIKTLNGESLLGSGNISISGGGSYTTNWDDILDKPEFSTVAITGSYNDLTDKPTNLLTLEDLVWDNLSGTPDTLVTNTVITGSGNVISNVSFSNGTLTLTKGTVGESDGNNYPTDIQVINSSDTTLQITVSRSGLLDMLDTLEFKTVNGLSIFGTGNIAVSSSGADGNNYPTDISLSTSEDNLSISIGRNELSPISDSIQFKTIAGLSIFGTGDISVGWNYITGVPVNLVTDTSTLGSGDLITSTSYDNGTLTFNKGSYVFDNGTNGNFVITLPNNTLKTINIGKPDTAGTADTLKGLTVSISDLNAINNKSEVSVSRSMTSGALIATININGTPNILLVRYATDLLPGIVRTGWAGGAGSGYPININEDTHLLYLPVDLIAVQNVTATTSGGDIKFSLNRPTAGNITSSLACVWTIPASILSTAITNSGFSSGISLSTADNRYLRKNTNETTTGTFTALAFYESSDVMLKNNISFIEKNTLSLSENIKFRQFKFNNQDTYKYGVIAQEVLNAGFDLLVNVDENNYKAVDYISLLCLKVASLEDKIENLYKVLSKLTEDNSI